MLKVKAITEQLQTNNVHPWKSGYLKCISAHGQSRFEGVYASLYLQ